MKIKIIKLTIDEEDAIVSAICTQLDDLNAQLVVEKKMKKILGVGIIKPSEIKSEIRILNSILKKIGR